MTETTEHNHQSDCLMCAVRALTEGVPPRWNPQVPGESISGVILKMENVSTNLGMVPAVDLWRGGLERVQIMAYGAPMRQALDDVAGQVGDTLTVRYDGERVAQLKTRTTTYRAFSANVQRGHGA